MSAVLSSVAAAPDLFAQENLVLAAARAVQGDLDAGSDRQRQALADLSQAYERLLRETRTLIRRSDREELEMNRLNRRLRELADELEHRATHDSLTGVLNRAAIIERTRRFLREDRMALVVLDIDHFKRVNDHFGHPVGDAVICGVVSCLQEVVPERARIGRVGGEEFTVLLPGDGLADAEALAERMRERIAGRAFDLPERHPITASFGVSSLAQGSSFHEAYCIADQALFEAKRAGRNRVVASSATSA